MLSSHVKRSPLLWLHNKSRLSQRRLWQELTAVLKILLLIAGFFPKSKIHGPLFYDSPLLHCKRKEFVFRSRFKGRVRLPFFSCETLFYFRPTKKISMWNGLVFHFSCWEILHSFAVLTRNSLVKYFSTLEENFVSPRGHVISSI